MKYKAGKIWDESKSTAAANANRQTGDLYPEDTITDNLLRYLEAQCADNVIVKRYRGRGEGGKNGTAADWEWWFIDNDRMAFGVRVQAKKLFLESNGPTYRDIFKSGPHGRQIDNLIRRASEPKGYSLTPLYAFYNTDIGATRTAEWLCEAPYSRDSGGGISIAFAQHLLTKTSERFDEIAPLTFPLHGLFGCKKAPKGNSLIQQIVSVLAFYASKHSPSPQIQPATTISRAPKHVKTALGIKKRSTRDTYGFILGRQTGITGIDMRDFMEEMVDDDPPDLAGLLILKV